MDAPNELPLDAIRELVGWLSREDERLRAGLGGGVGWVAVAGMLFVRDFADQKGFGAATAGGGRVAWGPARITYPDGGTGEPVFEARP